MIVHTCYARDLLSFDKLQTTGVPYTTAVSLLETRVPHKGKEIDASYTDYYWQRPILLVLIVKRLRAERPGNRGSIADRGSSFL